MNATQWYKMSQVGFVEEVQMTGRIVRMKEMHRGRVYGLIMFVGNRNCGTEHC